MIDKRELLEKARDRNIPLAMVEKDYVLGWLLFGFSRILPLVFKGGTALSKIYFPTTWRLSEDIDFAFMETDFEIITGQLECIFSTIKDRSEIELKLKSEFSNPEYLQLKIGYSAILGKNWIKVDATKEQPVNSIKKKKIQQIYTDYPDFQIQVESLEEILAEKLRALLERKKCRDYYDIWKLLELNIDNKHVTDLFIKKCRDTGIEPPRSDMFFPKDLPEILRPYWERELGRLVHPVPDIKGILKELKTRLADTLSSSSQA